MPELDIAISGQHDFILLDRSGSMQSNWAETLVAINAYVKGLLKENVDTRVTLAVFDGSNSRCNFDVIRDSVLPIDWKDVTDNDATPRGSTPLSDAIGKLVSLANKDRYDKVAIIIMTDGAETGSVLTVEQAKRLLQECRDKDWQVIMLGADFDNTQQAAQYGNIVGSSAVVNPANLVNAMTATSTLRSAYATDAAATMEYSAEQKKRFASPKT